MKNTGRQTIVGPLLDLDCGGLPISLVIAPKILARMRSETRPVPVEVSAGASPVVALTKREDVILELIACGDHYAEVAQIFSVSVGTLQNHAGDIYARLCVQSREAAVYEAPRRTLLQLESIKARARPCLQPPVLLKDLQRPSVELPLPLRLGEKSIAFAAKPSCLNWPLRWLAGSDIHFLTRGP